MGVAARTLFEVADGGNIKIAVIRGAAVSRRFEESVRDYCDPKRRAKSALAISA